MAVSKDKAGNSRDRFERIYRAMRSSICMLEYKPGSRLSEDDLAERFNVSRTPIRRVLNRLEEEGLVESRHGVGTIVTDVNFAELREAYMLRIELAALIGKLSPIPRKQDDLDRIRAVYTRSEQLLSQPDLNEFARLSLEFQMELTSMIGNTHLRQTARRLYFLTGRIWLTTLSEEELPNEIRVFQDEVREILAAMQLNDLETVGFIARNHISMSFTRLNQYHQRAQQEG